MCGIVGMFGFQVRADALQCVRRLTGLMARRGPDEEGYWQDAHCALGFRRLAILDLSPAGHQPMLTPNGRHALVFNGEVYNFPELRRELESAGVTFRSTGDTEVVLHALAVWGRNALARFNGMFALACYDVSAGKLLLARDPVGLKPLYYWQTGNSLVFGSQYDQLLAHPCSQPGEISQDGLALFLRLGYIPAPFGILKHTHLLEPGSWLEAGTDGALTRGRYFSFPQCSIPDLTGAAACEAVQATVAAAVKRQMVSDVPVGCFLSGGIDSPLVAANMPPGRAGPIPAFTIGLAGDPADESTDACQYARELPVRPVLRHFQPADVLSVLEEVVSACTEPLADDSIFPTVLASQLAREQVKVVLSGDGGDELFWGYAGRFASVLAVAGQFGRSYLARQGQRLLRRLGGRRQPGMQLVLPTIGDWYRAKHARWFEEQLAAIFESVPPLPPDFTLFDYAGHDPDETAQWLRWNEVVGHLTMVLLKVDRASMHHSLEVRVPLLDLEVVALATRIEWRSCLDLATGLGKRPLRAALARQVRHQTVAKRGFSVPMAEWLRGPLRRLMHELLLGRRELLGLTFKRGGLERLMADHLSGHRDHARGLWLLLSLALWEQRHFLNRCVASPAF